MYRMADTKMHKDDTDDMADGAAAFKKGDGICDGPHEDRRHATAWEAGWLNAMQVAVLGKSKKSARRIWPKEEETPKSEETPMAE